MGRSQINGKSGNTLEVDSNGAAQVSLAGSKQTLIQTHSGVIVPPSGLNHGNWIDASGFDFVGISFKNDGSFASTVYIYYSPDGVNEYGFDVIGGSTQTKKGVFQLPTRYVRISIKNDDAAPHTVNAYAYLKS
jgi:hypothetical protein